MTCCVDAVLSLEETTKACKLLTGLTGNINNVIQTIKNLTQQVNSGKYNAKKGLSLLDLKNNMFLTYMCNLPYTTLLKLSGKSLAQHPVIDRLIEERVVLERLHPYENKLKYEIEKYLKVDTTTGLTSVGTDDATSAGLSMDDFTADDDDDDDDRGKKRKRSAEEEDKKEDDGDEFISGHTKSYGGVYDDKAGGLYRVPKVSQNKYPGEQESATEKAAAARRRILSSAMMRDALYDHCDDPDVIMHGGILQRKAQAKRAELERYEEDNFTRVAVSRKDRAVMNAASTAGALSGELLGFTDVSLLDSSASAGGGGGERENKRRRTSKGKFKGQGKKKGGKKRH